MFCQLQPITCKPNDQFQAGGQAVQGEAFPGAFAAHAVLVKSRHCSCTYSHWLNQPWEAARNARGRRRSCRNFEHEWGSLCKQVALPPFTYDPKST